jgi:glucose/arabinose dehydrogenase
VVTVATRVGRRIWLAAAVLVRAALAGTPQETGFTETVYAQSAQLAEPTRILFAPDGSNRLFVVRKGGQVRIIKNGALLPTPFATVSPIEPNFEGGLLGIAFDHDYVTNRYVYLFGGVTLSEQQVIRYTDVNDVGQNKTIILRSLPTLGANHVGGGFAVGPDNHLYWGIGDLGNLTGVNADLGSLAAKIGRAQLDGGAPNDNPFNDGAGPNNDYIFARGFRNPYGLAFQPSTGQLWVTSCGNGYEQVWMIDSGDHAGWNTYENTQPMGFRAPVIGYRTGYFDSRQISNAGPTRTNGEATYPLMASPSTPPFRPGHKVTVRDVVDPSFNGDFYVKAMAGPDTLVVYQPGPNASSGVTNGFRYITTQELGGCVVGGGFYQSSAFPAAYRGNFFFADFVGNTIVRARPGPGNVLDRVDRFVNGVTAAVDVTSGPDGALYYAAFGPSTGTIYRLAHGPLAQGIVVSRTVVDVSEGGVTELSVSLAQAPAADVVVTVARTAGDPDVAVTTGASLTFTPVNWSTPQAVRIEAMPSAVAGTRAATVTASAASVPAEAVAVRV